MRSRCGRERHIACKTGWGPAFLAMVCVYFCERRVFGALYNPHKVTAFVSMIMNDGISPEKRHHTHHCFRRPQFYRSMDSIIKSNQNPATSFSDVYQVVSSQRLSTNPARRAALAFMPFSAQSVGTHRSTIRGRFMVRLPTG